MAAPPAFERTSDSAYQAQANAVLADIEATIDRWLQDDIVDIDTERTGGMLQLGFPNGSKVIVNLQPPLQELWLAAVSGGMHFRLVDGRWTDTKSRRDFYETLSACASEQAGMPLRFPNPR